MVASRLQADPPQPVARRVRLERDDLAQCGKGPDRAILALGYAGWRAGQLESEIAANGWLHCPADLDLLFDRNLEQKYDRAMSKIGIDPSHLVSDAGHA